MKQGLKRSQAKQERCAKKTCLFQPFGHEHYPKKQRRLLKRTLIRSVG